MTEILDPQALLRAYDEQLRIEQPRVLPEGTVIEWDGPLVRVSGTGRGFCTYQDVSHLSSDELDALIARQRDFFAARGERVEWKYRGHDLPEDLPQRLIAAGFEPEEQETVLIGLVRSFDSPAVAGVTLRQVTERADLDKIAEMNTEVWGEDLGWLADRLAGGLAADPEALEIYVAEADGKVVSAAWIRFEFGTDFAGLWGGSTLEHYRGRGIYKALVAIRAARAIDKGFRYLQVDASDNSRPILERLGFVAVTTTTPYMYG